MAERGRAGRTDLSRPDGNFSRANVSLAGQKPSLFLRKGLTQLPALKVRYSIIF